MSQPTAKTKREKGAALTRPAKPPRDAAKRSYGRGTVFPRAIAWFGIKSFWGHLWHLAASVIATEDIDSRDWMRADSVDELTRRLAGQIGADHDAPTLTEAIDDDLWIDFVSDTGDDVTVSEEVARMLFQRYEVDDLDDPSKRLVLPRGHVLIFGGDTAYPVATELEIHNRVIVPFNRVLRGAHDGKRRALLGVAGNHDWYAGLDGFGRMFRERRERTDRASAVATESIDPLGQIGHFIQWVEAFTVRGQVIKRSALPLEGYTPLQTASYWAVRAAPSLDFWGIDKQLRAVDFQQRSFFNRARDESRGLVLCIADPVVAYLEPSLAGEEILDSLQLSTEEDGVLILTGDTHHYTRVDLGNSVHVTAGGGGAFLHPTRISRRGIKPPKAEFPGPFTSRTLALGIPFQVANGRAGLLVHITFGVLYLLTYGLDLTRTTTWTAAAIVGSLVAALCLFLSGMRKGRRLGIAGLSVTTGAAIGVMPLFVSGLVANVAPRLGAAPSGTIWDVAILLIAVYVSTLVAGFFLMLLTMLGLRHDAFGALAHPGYKHFVRLRVRKDGSAIDTWVLGKVDPLAKDEPIVLVDRFTWHNPQAKG